MTRDDIVAFYETSLWFILFLSFLMQQNHETLMSLYTDMEMGTYVANSAGSSWTTRKKEERELIDHLLAHFAENKHHYQKHKVRKIAS